MTSSAAVRRPTRSPVLAVIVVVLVLIGAWIAFAGDSDASKTISTYRVTQGPLQISVVESGTIKPVEQIVISNQVQGQTTILSLVAEGTQVKQGDLLVELDASKLNDDKIEQEIRAQNAYAAFIRARENLEVTRSQVESDVSTAALAHRFAKEDLAKYTDGEYPNQLKEAESRIALSREELERANEKTTWSEKLSKERYISQSELQADMLAAKRAILEVDLAESALALLRDFTYQRRLAELTSDVTQTEMAWDRAKRKANADIVQAEADLKAKESENNRQQDKLAKFVTEIAKTRIIAPRDGLVVYATSAQGGWRGNSDPLQEGQQVRERQELIYLPTADGMKATINIHESQLGLVRKDLPARIDIDALPGQPWTGTVTQIAPLPDATQMWMNPDLKVYPTQVTLTEIDAGMRTGMSCRVEILVEHHDNAVQIPVQAVVRHGTQAVAWVHTAKGDEVRRITIGLDNGSMVHVIDGLKADEEVLLAPPLDPPPGFTSESFAPDIAAGVGTAPVTTPGPRTLAPTAKPNAAAPSATTEAQPPTPVAAPAGGDAPRGPADPAAREAMKKRMESMTPEEREKMREQWRQKQQAAGAAQ
jgi:HlyD family secretion protein